VSVVCALISVQTARADSDEERIARLEARIRELEARLTRAEKMASELANKADRPEKKAAAAKKSGPTRAAVTSAPSGTHATNYAQDGMQKPAVTVEQSTSGPPTVANPPAGAVAANDPQGGPQKQAARDLTPSEFNVFRDNAATLAQHHMEFALGAAYQKRNSALQSDRAALGFFNFRYGLMDGVEASLNVPFYYATRTTQISQSSTHFDSQSGIGDISAQISAIAVKETADWPALVAIGRLAMPTGKSPISFNGAYLVSGNPIDPLANYQTSGNWIPGVAAQIYKTLDPIIVFAGGGVNFPLPQSIQGHYIQYPPQFTYNMGFAFAVNEKTTFGIQVNGAVEGNYWVDGATVQQSEQEPISARLVLVQRVARDTYIEPAVTFGLSKDAPDAQLELTLRHRY
jgi:hypothetical protein